MITTGPAACIAATVLVAVSCHEIGSGAPTGHTIVASCVGFVPVTESRALNRCPGVQVVTRVARAVLLWSR